MNTIEREVEMWKSLHLRFRQLTPAQLIVSYYLLAITVSMGLLSLPFAHKEGVEWTFLDALFTAVSAVSVTGLSTISVADTFNTTGVFILMFVLQFGGVGIMTLGTLFWLLLGKRIGFRERRLIMTDQNQIRLSGLVHLLQQIFYIIILIELIGALILGLHFRNYFSTWKEAFLHGLFASVSATTNAGFDITGASLIPFANDYFVQFVTIILIILGSIGFPVLIETKDFLMNRYKNGKYHFSLYTKLTTLIYFVLFILGTVLIYLFEYKAFFADKVWHEALFYALFQSVTTKSSGLATVDMNQLTEATQLLLSGLMFIGASPSSVGGGIRTTTFALNLLFLFHFARGNRHIKIFKREIHENDVLKSLAVTLLAMILCAISVIILSITENHSLVAIIFEVTSAFGTTGLSMGITQDLSTTGKWVIMTLMFIGRVGILSFMFMIGGKEKKVHYHYPKERIIIG
jgi:potassium uptake TrkH family protein